MAEKKLFVDGAELTIISRDLYKYIRSIDVGCSWHNEYLESDELPCICFKKKSVNVEKLNANIKGGYNAEIEFDVFYRNEVKDTKQTLEIVEPLNKLGDTFYKEQINGFPNLNLTDERVSPVTLEMTVTPAEYSPIENNIAVFSASYKFTYKKKGDFE